ncbi:hypothetical protein EDD22DRAFT_968460 [Suillus occidentalis]|nr:hypothetical protein EDD22DRAFT_968460 [Suillus occidentalis]
MNQDHFSVSSEGTWEKLSQVAVKGAEYDSRERRPHPKCLQGTRVDLLKYIHRSLDDREKSRLIWLHGTAGVGKSAVPFTVAETMRDIKVTEDTHVEKRLAGTFFFSRKHTKRCTTGYFFATLVYQLATNFPSIRTDVNRTIRDNPALLDPDKSLRDQVEAFFIQPLRRLHLRLRGCPPLAFVVGALDECTSETELTDLILYLARALRESDLPVAHILLTSRSESHICKAFQNVEVRPWVCEIPVKTSGEGVAATISLDGADVDKDIYIFLHHSLTELQSRHPDFPQPSRDELERLASRAGRRFIVASTMMKFIDDGDSDPRDRLQVMLDLASELLPGTEVYKLYDRILSTCADPKRAYQYLSIVAALADPLPISQLSKLLGPGLGRDVETVLMQLRSVMDIPTEGTLPVNIYHSSVRDYASDPSNCNLSQVRDIPSPHSLLAHSSFRLMMKEIPERSALLDLLSDLKKHSQAMKSQDPKRLKESLSFLVQPPEPLSVLVVLLWLRGDRSSDLEFWLGTQNGHAWLTTPRGTTWLCTMGGENWLQTQGGHDWLQTQGGKDWLQAWAGKHPTGKGLAANAVGKGVVGNLVGKNLVPRVRIRTPREDRTVLNQIPLHNSNEQWADWLQTPDGLEWLQTPESGGHYWLSTSLGNAWLGTIIGKSWLETPGGRDWLQTFYGNDWLQSLSAKKWMRTRGGHGWLNTKYGRDWLLETHGGREWSETHGGREWLETHGGREWLEMHSGREWLETQSGQDWLETQSGRDWLQTQRGRNWLQTRSAKEWLKTQGGQDWLETRVAENARRESLATDSKRESLAADPERARLVANVLWRSMAVDSCGFCLGYNRRILEHSGNDQREWILPRIVFAASFPSNPAIQELARSLDVFGFSPDREIIHAMNAFVNFANEATERSRSSSDALKYACQNWAIHLSGSPNPWDETLNHIFKIFWNRHLLSWLERQWCLKGLQSCFVVLHAVQTLAKSTEILPLIIKTSTKEALAATFNTWTQPSAHISSINPLPPPLPPTRLAFPNATVSDVGISAKRTLDELWTNGDSPNRFLSHTSSKRPKRDQQNLRIGTQPTTTNFHFCQINGTRSLN